MLPIAVMSLAALVAAAGLAVHWVPANPHNYAHGYRPGSLVRQVVVHVTEGTYPATIAWFRNPRARVSAHFVVSRDGDVTQMVSTAREAWHAGNPWTNLHSIGVENEGFVGIPWTFTDAEYRASAQLVASLMRHYVLPIDRRHLIGHSQVPDPFHPGEFGGFGHHTDPGRYWSWQRYLSYVRAYARGGTPPPPQLDVDLAGMPLVESATGTVHLEADTTGDVQRVDFRLDDAVVGSSTTQPFTFDWDSTAARNGSHVLGARAVAADGRTVDANVVVHVSNPPLRITGTSLYDGEVVGGVVPVTVTVNRPPQRLELVVDGTVRATSTQAAYVLQWDTTLETPGVHLVTIRAVTHGYALAKVDLAIDVEQPAPPPSP